MDMNVNATTDLFNHLAWLHRWLPWHLLCQCSVKQVLMFLKYEQTCKTIMSGDPWNKKNLPLTFSPNLHKRVLVEVGWGGLEAPASTFQECVSRAPVLPDEWSVLETLTSIAWPQFWAQFICPCPNSSDQQHGQSKKPWSSSPLRQRKGFSHVMLTIHSLPLLRALFTKAKVTLFLLLQQTLNC